MWVLNTVGCVNHAAEDRPAANERFAGAIDGIHAFAHPYGCSQLGDDLKNTQRVLAGLMRHPNAGGVLDPRARLREQPDGRAARASRATIDREPHRVLQHAGRDRRAARRASGAVAKLVERMRGDRARASARRPSSCSATSAAAPTASAASRANPLVGRIADRLTSLGGSVLLTEVPEMFGAEQRADEPRRERAGVRRHRRR